MKSLYRFGRFAVFVVVYLTLWLLVLMPVFLMWVLAATVVRPAIYLFRNDGAFWLGRGKHSQPITPSKAGGL